MKMSLPANADWSRLRPLLRDSLPPPDAAEERMLVIAAQAGDRAAMDRLVRGHMPLIAVVTLRFHRESMAIPVEDAFQEGLIGFMEAVATFDLASGYRLITYAKSRVRWAILLANPDYLRIRPPRTHTRPRPPPIRCRSETELSRPDGKRSRDVFGGRTDPEIARLEDAEEAAQVCGWLVSLPDHHRVIVERVHGIGVEAESYAQVGADLGVSKQAVAERYGRALKRLGRLAWGTR